MDGDGELRSDEDMKETLDYWALVRSKQSHGVVIMRDRSGHMLASEMEFIIETVQGAEVKPSKYTYAIYKPEDVQDHFEENRNASVKEVQGGYRVMPFHKFAVLNDMPERMKVNLANANSELYLVEYNSVCRVTSNDIQYVQVDNLDGALKETVKEYMAKLN